MCVVVKVAKAFQFTTTYFKVNKEMTLSFTEY